jgi:DNA sulfur modification protein DndC
MKIQPTTRYVRDQVNAAGQVILLLGVRRDESSTRAGTVARYDNGRRLSRHNDMADCMVFRPIVNVVIDEIWEFLATQSPPWGGSHQPLITLYRNSLGGECPVVTQKIQVSETAITRTNSSATWLRAVAET